MIKTFILEQSTRHVIMINLISIVIFGYWQGMSLFINNILIVFATWKSKLFWKHILHKKSRCTLKQKHKEENWGIRIITIFENMGMEWSFYSYDINCFQLTILKACRISMNISRFFRIRYAKIGENYE